MVEPNDDRIEDTKEDVGELLFQGLEEARAIARGSAEPARRGSAGDHRP